MKLTFEETQPRQVVHVHKRVDGPWFWTRYSAHPYVGCRSGCTFCYLRGGHYLGKRDPATFDTLIQVKTNVVERLRFELSRLERDVLACGDWQQPAEDRYRLSRQMLEVAHELSFPVFIVERSPLLERDLDLLKALSRRSWVGVVLSFSNLSPGLKAAFEPRSPGLQRRLQCMERLASAGILVGASLMPIIPFVGDDTAHLDEAVRMTAAHGGRFVLGAGMSMEGTQAALTWEAAGKLDPELPERWRKLYGTEPDGTPSSSAPREYKARLGQRVRELCERHGLLSRMPRYIPDGPLAVNKWVAERLFLRCWELDLELASPSRVWAYRKAAWTVDVLPRSLVDIHQQQPGTGLRRLPEMSEVVARDIERWLLEWPARRKERVRATSPSTLGPLFDAPEEKP
ncbi:radical SAM domain-containing protein [Myxococcus stipitatus DSM 14675]|uniref:Radical SAM domain-containing protein n=1 Tax=Myxococcus stipitatus (strain DSM 14675 / JCM 12634 / Mx s8) TaxID=1278073 RepID=L7UE20_MYXSD|nr:radical SAM protein [Myxococcus stipitatus]AGC46100.1 radical SAM domain-containing protein [Myxococcus stipitatus DSM 14675]